MKRGAFSRRRLMQWSAGAALAVAAPAWARESTQKVEVAARAIANFQIGSTGTRFGPLEFNGGLEMSSTSRDFGGLSSFRFLQPGAEFIGVADTGFWFFGKLEHDVAGRPSGMADFSMQQFVDKSGKAISEKWEVDAESIAVRDGYAVVGFERRHRISLFKIDRDAMQGPIRDLDFLIPARELRQNRGFEAISYAPLDGPLKGALVAVTEKSLDKQGNVFAAILDGPQKGVFSVKKNDRYDITDSAFLPNGDLLLLERAFSMATGVGMRLRRLPVASLVKGAQAVDGSVLFEADMRYQIDNLEAMDVWRRADGATMVSLISDDNHSILQRNLYLEFILHDD